jgi:two-component system chemotaxis sensor kinase CheA
MAIIDGMSVRVGADTMTIPLTSVVELLSPRYSKVSTFEGKGELVDVRGEFLPVIRLSEVFEVANQSTSADDPTIVIVETSGRRFGVLVDRVLGMDQTVVKPLHKTFGVARRLDHNYQILEAVSGATILGDGNVALILDVPGIERMAFGDLQ